MPIDPTGTTPGLVPENPNTKVVHAKCRRDGCDSIQATVTTLPAQPGRQVFHCVKCHHAWGVNVGGTFNY